MIPPELGQSFGDDYERTEVASKRDVAGAAPAVQRLALASLPFEICYAPSHAA